MLQCQASYSYLCRGESRGVLRVLKQFPQLLKLLSAARFRALHYDSGCLCALHYSAALPGNFLHQGDVKKRCGLKTSHTYARTFGEGV